MATCHFGLQRKSRQSSQASFPPQFRCSSNCHSEYDACYMYKHTYLFLLCLDFMGKHFDIFPRLMPTAHKAFPCRPGLDITRHQRPQAPTKHAIISNGRDQSSNEESDEEAEDTSSSEAKTLGIKASLSGIISSQPCLRKTRKCKHDPQG